MNGAFSRLSQRGRLVCDLNGCNAGQLDESVPRGAEFF